MNGQQLPTDSLNALSQRYHDLLTNPEPDPALRQLSRIGRLYKVTDKYADDKLASIKYALDIPVASSFRETGTTTEFYPDGKLRRSRTPEGEGYRAKEYFSNGEPYREYMEKGEVIEMVTVWDTDGGITVKEGNGRALEMHRYDDEVVLETGVYENGRRTGGWKGYTDRPYFTEVYQAGHLVSGESWDGNGRKFSYKVKMEPVVFVGGEQKLYSFLGRNIEVPRRMQAGQVRVNARFLIDTEGKVDSLQILNEAPPENVKEASRVVRATSGKWVPGKRHGQPVKMWFTLPIVFVLK